MNRGKFITIEGSEGVGKSTNVDAVCAELDGQGIGYYQTREPGGTAMAESLRELLLAEWVENVDPLTELLLVFTARNQHIVNEIEPRLAAGEWVVCDRFTDASFAYQGSARGLDAKKIEVLESWVQGALQPDLTLYLDLDPNVAFTRIADRQHDRMEQEDMSFFRSVRAGYLARAQLHDRIKTINAADTLEEVRAAVRQIVSIFVATAKQDSTR